MNNVSRRAIYYQQAERLYVENGISLDIIEDLFDTKIEQNAIAGWKKEFSWDTKRSRFLESNNTLIEEAKELVNISLANAKEDPTTTKIGAYKRAVDALKALEAIKSVNHEKDDKQKEGLTPDKAETIRKEVLGI